MAENVRSIRLANEWELIVQFCKANQGILSLFGRRVTPEGDVFRLLLKQTDALVLRSSNLEIVHQHEFRLHFPRFFPAEAIEATLDYPVFHPNIDLDNGFVCLWNRFTSDYTSVDAIARVQQIISWGSVNEDPRHAINTRALDWYKTSGRTYKLPLPMTALQAVVGHPLIEPLRANNKRINRRILE